MEKAQMIETVNTIVDRAEELLAEAERKILSDKISRDAALHEVNNSRAILQALKVLIA